MFRGLYRLGICLLAILIGVEASAGEVSRSMSISSPDPIFSSARGKLVIEPHGDDKSKVTVSLDGVKEHSTVVLIVTKPTDLQGQVVEFPSKLVTDRAGSLTSEVVLPKSEVSQWKNLYLGLCLPSAEIKHCTDALMNVATDSSVAEVEKGIPPYKWPSAKFRFSADGVTKGAVLANVGLQPFEFTSQ